MPLGRLKCYWEIIVSKYAYPLLTLVIQVSKTPQHMKNLLSTFVGIMAFCSLTWAQPATVYVKQAEQQLKDKMDKKIMVGVAAGMSKDGKVLWQNGAGHRDREQQQPANPEMIHRIASISKPMTAIAILQLYEQKKLALDDPIQQYLPYFPEKKEGKITIRHLLHHISGIKAYQKRREAFSTKNYPTLRDAIAVFEKRKLANVPGEGYRYTTYGYVVLGAIIEKAAGMSYRSYMKKNVWEKAGMTHTDVEIFGKQHPNKAKLYRRDKKGNLIQDKNTDLSIKVPGGGIQSTVGDLLKFGQAIIEHKLIQPTTFQLMIQDPGIKKRGNPYGMGWFIYGRKGEPGGRVIGHSGSQSGTSTQLLIYLDKKVVTAALCNTSGVWTEVFDLTARLGRVAMNSHKESE